VRTNERTNEQKIKMAAKDDSKQVAVHIVYCGG